jgi:hypothetical protein
MSFNLRNRSLLSMEVTEAVLASECLYPSVGIQASVGFDPVANQAIGLSRNCAINCRNGTSSSC